MNTFKKAMTAVTLLTLGLFALDATAAGHRTDGSEKKKSSRQTSKILKKKKAAALNPIDMTESMTEEEKKNPDLTSVSGTGKASVSVSQMKSSTAKSLKASKFSISDASFFFGPAMIDPMSGTTASDSIGTTDALYTRHLPSIGYKINDKMKVSANGDFTIKHTRPEAAPSARGLTVNDPFLKLAMNDLISTEIAKKEISVAGQVRYYAPVSDGSVAAQRRGSVRAYLSPSVELTKRLNLTVDNYAHVDLNSQTVDSTGGAMRRYKLYTGPTLTFDINKNLSAFALYEAFVAFDTKGVASTTKNTGVSHADFEPGMNITLNKTITLSPFLNWYTAQPIKTTSVNLLAIFNLF